MCCEASGERQRKGAEQRRDLVRGEDSLAVVECCVGELLPVERDLDWVWTCWHRWRNASDATPKADECGVDQGVTNPALVY